MLKSENHSFEIINICSQNANKMLEVLEMSAIKLASLLIIVSFNESLLSDNYMRTRRKL